ncbi:ATPase [Dysgonomonas sp. 521]|uniref:AAA family ATPase n=1 Tax=Dysgonomonas sp. 521 TaxID=2302932 RepID=UPI0013D6F3B8|nr:AAA family ATPase [Dysgonomonas sp. 521]NDV96276.1 ATPase [Dysgonomonas sp. 521]
MRTKNNYHIITGGPGVGKTTLICELRQRGYNCVHEVARHIIKEQMETNGDALPWLNTRKYSDLMLSYSIGDFIEYSDVDELLFFDRGIPDTYGYEVLMKFPENAALKDAIKTYRYSPTVFILPPWVEIYSTDDERKQDFSEALRTYEVMRNVYTELGYKLIEVPKASPAERADFVINSVHSMYKNEKPLIK